MSRKALMIAVLCSMASVAHAEGWICKGEHSGGVAHDVDGNWNGVRFDDHSTFTVTPNKRNTENPYTVKLQGDGSSYAYCGPISNNGWLYCGDRTRFELNTNNNRFLYFRSVWSYTMVGAIDSEGQEVTDKNAKSAVLTVGGCALL